VAQWPTHRGQGAQSNGANDKAVTGRARTKTVDKHSTFVNERTGGGQRSTGTPLPGSAYARPVYVVGATRRGLQGQTPERVRKRAPSDGPTRNKYMSSFVQEGGPKTTTCISGRPDSDPRPTTNGTRRASRGTNKRTDERSNSRLLNST